MYLLFEIFPKLTLTYLYEYVKKLLDSASKQKVCIYAVFIGQHLFKLTTHFPTERIISQKALSEEKYKVKPL